MQTLPTLANEAMVEIGQRRQKRKFNLLLTIFFALVAMTAIAIVPVVRQYAESEVAVATWTDGLTPQAFGSETWAGSGTETDAFQIASAVDLAQLACNVNAGTTYEGMCFTLTQEVNLMGKEWTPIGTVAHPFMGTFNGGQKAIYFMTITGGRYDYVGLFGVVQEGLLTKIDMRNGYINISGGEAAGSIAGYAENTDISYCTNGVVDIEKLGFPTNEVDAVAYAGLSTVSNWFTEAYKRGVVSGGAIDETMTGGVTETYRNTTASGKTHGTGTVSGSSANCGGIAGYLRQNASGVTTLSSCWNQGNVSASSSSRSAGGIVGIAHADTYVSNSGDHAHVTVSTCANAGTVYGTYAAGGIVGFAKSEASNDLLGGDKNASVYMIESYTIGSVTCSTSGRAGSIFGYEVRDAHRSNAYVHVGGANGGANPYCYWTETGCSGSYGSSGINKNNGSSQGKNQLVSSSSGKSGWTSSKWNEYDATSSVSGTTRTYKQLTVSPSGASVWTAKSSSPYNYYTWTETLSTYTITFNKNNGTGGTSSTSVVDGNKIGSITTPTRTGYNFKGYYTSTSGGTQYVNSSGTGTTTVSKTMTLYAQWEAKEITVKFYVNTTSRYSYTSYFDESYGYGGWPSSVSSSYLPSGYTFSGNWYSSYTTSGSVRCGSGTIIYSSTSFSSYSSTVSLYAGLDSDTYRITLSASDATNTASSWGCASYWTTSGRTAYQDLVTNEIIGTLPEPTRTGYTFDGWYSSSWGWCDGDDTISQDRTYYAQWIANTYTVTLNKNNGSGGSNSVTATYGSSMPSASAPSRSYYTFNGYYTSTSGGTQYYTSSMGSARTWNKTSNTTLYAQWTAKSITVNFNVNGGSSVNAQTVSYGSTLGTLPTPSRTGYSFAGWFKESSLTNQVSSSTTLNSSNFSTLTTSGLNITLYAKWTKQTFDVKLSASEASSNATNWEDVSGWTADGKIATKNFSYGDSLGATPTPSRVGYTFKGWYTSQSGGTQYISSSELKFTSTTTLYAQWTAITYTLTIAPNGGAYSSETSVTGTVGTSVTLGMPTLTGYTFGGWEVTSGSGTVSDNGNAFTFDASNATVTAKWAANQYKLTFNANGGTWANVDGFTKDGDNYYKMVTYGQPIGVMPTVTKAGWNFSAWYTGTSGGNAWNENKVYDTAGAYTLYARYTENSYTLTVDKADGSAIFTYNGTYNSTYTLPNPTREGYQFTGWTITSGDGSLSGLVFTFRESNATVTAQWTNNIYYVNYNGNGNTGGSMTSSEFTYDVNATLRQNGFTRTGYEFVGWNTSANNTGTSYIDKASVRNLTSENGGSVTLYAQWGTIKYIVTFDANGGTIQDTTGFAGSTGRKTSSVTYLHGYTIDVLPDVLLTGFIFDGWKYENGDAVTANDQVLETMTLYAAYSPKTFTLTLNALSGTLPTTSGWTLSSDGHSISKTIAYDAQFDALPTPTNSGSMFLGWFDSQTGGSQYVETSVFKRESNLTLYAHYSVNLCTVFFDPAGGSATFQQMTLSYGEKIGTLPTATKTGYDFEGWYYIDNPTKKSTTNDVVNGNITLAAQWAAKQFIITFDARGGIITGVTGQTTNKGVYYNDTFGDLPTVTKVGSKLRGWYDDVNGNGNLYTSNSVARMTQNLTLYAVWEVETLTVVFNGNGGQCSVSSKNYDYGAEYGTLPEPTRVGYGFLGWATSLSSTSYVSASGTVTTAHTLYAQWKANVYYVEYQANRNDTTGTMERSTFTYDEAGTLRTLGFVCQKAEFTGWNTNASGTGTWYSDGQSIRNIATADGATITLYAQWSENNYVVSIDVLNYTVVNNNGFTAHGMAYIEKGYKHGDRLGTLPVLSKAGHTFTGYKNSSTGAAVTADTLVTDDMTLLAQFTANEVTITFKPNGGTFTSYGQATQSGDVATLTVNYGDRITSLPTVELSGYQFDGFYEEGDTGFILHENMMVLIEEPTLVLEAHWTSNTYVLTFNAGSGTITPTEEGETPSNTYTYDVSYNRAIGYLPSATWAGHTFNGWYTAQTGGDKITAETVYTTRGNSTVYARYDASSYKVTADANGGSFSTSATVSSKEFSGDFGQDVALEAPTRTGYTFTGYSKTSGEGTLNKVGEQWKYTMGAGDATVEAQWRANTYTVTFDYEGGSCVGGNITSLTATYGQPFGILPTAESTGKRFVGWFRENNTQVVSTDIMRDTAPFTLYARYSLSERLLTINPNGGVYDGSSSVATKTGAAGGTVDILTPTRLGYTFNGWKEQAGSYAGLNTEQTVYTFGADKDGNIVAQWTPITYTITFVGNGNTGGSMDDLTVAYDELKQLTQNAFTKTGYSFNGWTCDGISYADKDNIRNLTSTNGASFTFTAQWAANSYTLTIDPNGGKYDGSTTMCATTGGYGATYNVDTPERTGYTFNGWTKSGSGELSDANVFTFGDGNGTLTAQWTVKTIKVYLDPNGATWVDNVKDTFHVDATTGIGYIEATYGETYGTIPTASDLVYAGHQFVSFYTSDNIQIISSNIVTYEEDITLTAQFTTNGYTLSINPDGGIYNQSPRIQDFAGEMGDEIDILTPTRTGYTFNQWELVGSGELIANNTKFKFGDSNATLTALWTANTYTVTFDANGGDGTMANQTFTYAETQKLSKNTFTKTGYTFSGWLREGNSVSDGTIADEQQLVNLTTENGVTIKFIAQWTVINYTISFNANGGTIDSTLYTRNYGDNYGGFPTATKSGYVLDGWYTELSGGDEVTEDDIVTGAVTLYAHWTAQTYTVTLRGNGGKIAAADGYTGATNVETTTIEVTYGELYSGLPVAEHETLVFMGWYTAREAGVLVSTADYVSIPRDHDLYARWSSNEFVVSFNAHGGSASIYSIRVNYGEAYGTLPTATRIGYDFAGWYLDEDKIEASTRVATKDDHTLMARWDAKEFTLSFAFGDGEYFETAGFTGTVGVSGVTMTVAYDAAYGVLPMAKRTGYEFVGWYMGENLITSNSVVSILEDKTLVAVYREVTYRLVIELSGGLYGGMAQAQTFSGIYNEEIELLTPTRRGYKFIEFSNDGTYGEVSGNAINGYKFKFTDGDTTLVVVWEALDIEVTFHAQEGTIDSTNMATSTDKKTGVRNYKFGDRLDKVDALPNCVLDGFRFVGWFTIEGLQITDAMVIDISQNFDLYAKYSPIYYTLTVNPNGGEFNGVTITTSFEDKRAGETVEFNEPTRVGYSFKHFVLSGAGSLEKNADGTYTFTFGVGNGTLTAEWDSVSYVVTFEYDGATGGNATANKAVVYDAVYGTLPSPSKTGYVFAGWYSASEGGVKVEASTSVKTAENHSLYARWERQTYTLQVILSGGAIDGTVSTDKLYSGFYGDTVEFSKPTRVGYDFDGFEKVGDKGSFEIVGDKVKFTFGDDNGKLIAKWKAQLATVTLDAGAGAVISGTENQTTTIQVEYGFTYGKHGELGKAVKVGYNFVGWYLELPDGDEKEIIYSVIVETVGNHTLVAKYKEIETSLTILLNGGEMNLVENPVKRTFGTTYTLGSPTRDGYTFTGYVYQGNDASALVDNHDGTYAYTFGSTDAVITAQWGANTYTVTFDAGAGAVIEGTENQTTTIQVEYGARYNKNITTTLPAASKYGYTFDGWYTNGGNGELIIDTSIVSIAGAHTLTAKYSQPEYSLRISLDGGTLTGQALTVSGKHAGETCVIGTPTKTGYDFDEWVVTSGAITIAASGSNWQLTFGESDASIIATYTAKTYSLTFDGNGGTIPASATSEWTLETNGQATKSVTYGEKVGIMPTPTKSGSQFLGWSTQLVTSGTPDTLLIYTALTTFELTADTALYAVWSEDQYVLTIELNGGRLGEITSNIQAVGSNGNTYEITGTPEKDGYDFVRFDLTCAVEGQGSLSGNTFTFGAGNAVISCVYEPKTITVTLNAGSGAFDASTLGVWGNVSADGKTVSRELKYGDKLGVTESGLAALPQVTLKGNKFTGWFIGDVQYAETYTIEWTENVTLTASFAKNNYALVINTNGGTYSDGVEYNDKVGVFNISKEYGETYTVVAPTKVGYTFMGWTASANTEGEGSFNTDTGVFTFGADTFTLVAEYQSITYYVEFNANGGEGTMANQTLTYDQASALNKNQFTRAGYLFNGWKTETDDPFADNGMIYNAASTQGATITLYAQWKSATITHYFDANDGSARPIALDVEFGAAFGTLPVANRTGYDFGGWYPSIYNGQPNGEALTSETTNTYTESHTFVAYWTIASYTITMPTGFPENSIEIAIREGYTTTVVYNNDFVFTIDVLEAYSQSNIRVRGNGKEILRTDGVYRLERVFEDTTITIEGLHINEYTVVFDSGNGSAVPNATVEWGKRVPMPSAPTLVHYKFDAWYKDAGLMNEFDFSATVIKEDIVLYAKYERATYTINFYVEDEVYTTQNVLYLGRVDKPTYDPTLEGHDFVGWYLMGETTPYAFSSQVTGNMDLYAQFSKNTYVVNFYSGEKFMGTMNVRYGEQVVVNFATGQIGYTFEGWYEDRALTRLFDFDTIISSDITLYAKYTLNLFTVSFYVNYELKDTQTVGWGRTATMPTTINVGEGYHISSWYYDPELTNEYDFIKPVENDFWLYGKVERDQVSITFMANGQEVRTVAVDYGSSFDASAVPIPARTGYTQVAPYWEDVDLSCVMTPVTVNAIYTINTYTIKIVMPDGSEIYRTVEHGETLTDLPEVPTKFGDKIVFDMDLANITQDMVVKMEVKNYIFWPMIIAGGILLVLAIVLITICVVKVSKKKNSRNKIKELISTKGR